MSGKKCWEQNFDFLIFFDFTDQNMSKKWLFWDFLDFRAPKIEKKGKKGFFQTCFHLGFGRFSAQMDYLGKSSCFVKFSGNWIQSGSTMGIGLYRDIENSVSRQRSELFQFRIKR